MFKKVYKFVDRTVCFDGKLSVSSKKNLVYRDVQIRYFKAAEKHI